MNTKLSMKSSLIALCGMNCGICRAYLREKKKCPGCRGSNESKSFSCANCKIKNCNELNKNNLKKEFHQSIANEVSGDWW